MAYFNFVARAYRPRQPFLNREACAELWGRLQNRFKTVAACVLMPNHLHLAMETTAANEVRRTLSIELRAFTRRHYLGKGGIWEAVPEPEPIADAPKLKLLIRYIHLNPCRARLVADPLDWEWSTHRDYLSAASPSWVERGAMARLWKTRDADFSEVFHRYVSSDPSVRVDGTALPRANPAGSLVTFDSVVRSVQIATRSSARLSPETRGLAVHLADRVAKGDRQNLAERLGVHKRSVFKIAAVPVNAAALEAAWLVLSDPRLLGGKDSRVKGR
jgi:REP element-mobilizing transposase RayT